MGSIYFFYSDDEKDTIRLGKNIGEILKGEEIILLRGKLGSGKTRLVKGIARGMNITNKISSPTYNLINEYEGDIPLYHMDLYRLDNEMDLYNIGFEDYLYRKGVVVIEWPELAASYITEDFFLFFFVVFYYNKRFIKLRAEGKSSENLLKGLSNYEDIRD